jgi:hypothetical protein
VSDGRRWLALDADLFAKPFTDQLLDRFGWAGVATWIAFLCACKRSRPPGQITVYGDDEALVQMGIFGRPLVDDHGGKWTLEDFWGFTGRMKQTRRTSRGRTLHVRATHWGRWQVDAGRAQEAERKASQRARKQRTDPGQTPDRCPNGAGPDRTGQDTPLPPNELPLGALEDFKSLSREDPSGEPVVMAEAIEQLRQVMKR